MEKQQEVLKRFTAKHHAAEVIRMANSSYHGSQPIKLCSWLLSHKDKLPVRYKGVSSKIMKWAKDNNIIITGSDSELSPTPIPEISDKKPVSLSDKKGMEYINAIHQAAVEVTNKIKVPLIKLSHVEKQLVDDKKYDTDTVNDILAYVSDQEKWSKNYLVNYRAGNAVDLLSSFISEITAHDVIICSADFDKSIIVSKSSIKDIINSAGSGKKLKAEEMVIAKKIVEALIN